MRSFLVFLLAGHAGLLAAQSSAIHVDHFTADDGLAQNLVMRVLQDRAGYIWVATKRGLQRYDGYSFVQYTSLNRNAPAALDGLIGYLEYDGRDHLWASAQGSLYRISLGTQQVVRIALDSTPTAWRVAADGRVWVLDKRKLKVIEPGATPHTRIVPTPPQFRVDARQLFVTREGAIWSYAFNEESGSIQRFDPATGTVRWLDLESTKLPFAAMEDSDGRLWLAGLGVGVVDPGSDRVRSLGAFRGVGTVAITADGATALVATAIDVVRVSSAGTVIQRWSPPILSGGSGLPRDVAIDREGGVWLATTTSGLYRFDAGRPLFDYVSSKTIPAIGLAGDFVTALRELPDSSIWIGTMTSGAYRLSADGTKAEVFRRDPRNARSLGSDLVWGFEEDAAGQLWLATGRGLCTRSPGGFSCYRRPPDGATIADVARDAQGWLWAIEYEPTKVGSFNPVTREYGNVAKTQHIGLSLYADPDSNYLWVGGEELLRARVRAGKFLTPLQPVPGDVGIDNLIYDFHRDRSGVMWIASESGLQHWDGTKHRFTPVAVPELRNTTVFSIVEDQLGRLWLGTAHGLVHYAPASGIARRFRKQDGVLSGEFNRRAALRRRNGEMLFGGIQGMTRFRPEVVTAGRIAAPVVFTRLTRVAENRLIEGSIDNSAQIKLDKDDRAFTIAFAALTFAAGPARRYRYQLESLNKSWIETSEHAVTYATPPPGHYVFRVQTAGGSDGEWSTPGAAMTIDVVPPFWGTGWFKSLTALAAIVGLWLLHRLRLARVLATERVRLRISRDLHDEIGVGLSSIALLSESVGTTGEITERDRTRLNKITQAARRMVADLRDIIWAIDPDEDHVEDVVARMRDEASVLLQDIDVSFNTPPASELAEGIGMAARRDLLLIFKEVLHNIARHAQARAVQIELTVKRDRVRLIVSDNGVGFDPQAVRTGTGVKSMRERAARLGGRLDIISRPGLGTSVVLSLRARERAMAGPLAYR